MFLSRRSAQAEYFDAARSPVEIARFCAEMERLNQFFAFAEPFQRFIPRILGNGACRRLAILDIGAGNGLLGKMLETWGAGQGWDWQVTSLDISRKTLALSKTSSNVTGSALALPFRSGSFDLVIASQMTHHLDEAQARAHLKEAWRVAGRAILVVDLHRNPLLYLVVWFYLRLNHFDRTFVSDATISVKKAWRLNELENLAAAAGIPAAEAHLYFGARVVLHAKKATNPSAGDAP